MICFNCKREIPDGSLFCNFCGSKVEEQLKCPACGKVIPEDSAFCPFCGMVINNNYGQLSNIDNNNEVETKNKKNSKILIICLAILFIAAICGWTAYENSNIKEMEKYIKRSSYEDYTSFSTYKSQELFKVYEDKTFFILKSKADRLANDAANDIYTKSEQLYYSKDYANAYAGFVYLKGKILKHDNVLTDEYPELATYIELSKIGEKVQKSQVLSQDDIDYLFNHGEYKHAYSMIVSNSGSAVRFLKGKWTDSSGKEYFEIKDEAGNTCITNLPKFDLKDWSYHISDGIFTISNSNESKQCLKITVIDKDEVEVFCFKDRTTHTLYRE